ncbi:uncharacterized protein BO95DRAFT_68585 [Aspergillus brunneoviolaceus CBS 621.78]|uniref:Uncharacterized protein n=1 Tax=Aspergillus brunneoviolaceus CBS 621.78 TaxID=1450534 RepID=A0ACD1GFT7_9EURO|nr:hypothetical protein BO95DRAFT_68585 [Aspergillus brunneoviolaceus CBS 621.78]RAH48116.1 hypothetical protein BO95DRAFT_68585 [Aspergillus brunneoviolaceus CBS 621.78]
MRTCFFAFGVGAMERVMSEFSWQCNGSYSDMNAAHRGGLLRIIWRNYRFRPQISMGRAHGSDSGTTTSDLIRLSMLMLGRTLP